MPSDSPNILPDSRTHTVRGRISICGTTYIPIYCASCGAPGGGVPEEHVTFAFWLCTPCSDKHGAIANTYSEPDAIFFERVKQVQMEEYGRPLNEIEILKALDDESSALSKLAREAPKGK